MFRSVLVKLVTETVHVRRPLTPASFTGTSPPRCSGFIRGFNGGNERATPPFDVSLLELLVCPLSKKTLRYESQTNELINDELGIAYPVTEDGIPNMIPQDARLIRKQPEDVSTTTTQD